MKKMVWIMVIALTLALAFTACKELKPEPEPTHVHQWEWTKTASPTCTATGVETGVCKLDSSHTTTREIAVDLVNGHNFAAGAYLCSVCNNPYELGNTGPGGGKIFYRTATGFTMTDDNSTAHYLEAAPADMATPLAWASSAFIPPVVGTGDWTDIAGTATAIGTGRKNTALILAIDADAPAAKACNDYSNGGKTDWFLPSKNELNELSVNRTSVGNMGTGTYWSSLQLGNPHASCQRLSDGSSGGASLKDYPRSVRAVRAF